MTKLLRKLEPRGASQELHSHEESVKKAVYSKVASDTVRGMLAVVSIIMLVTMLVFMVFQQVKLADTLKGIEANRQVAVTATDKLSNISVFAAYCAKLPENNTIDSIQRCIETLIKQEGKK